MRVLVAEDNPATATYIRTVFERRGWSVEVVLDGAQAIECIERERFDAVLVDGIDVLRAVRQKSVGPVPPYLAVITVVDSIAAKQFCIACGANGFFTKPVDPDAIIASIEEYYRDVKKE